MFILFPWLFLPKKERVPDFLPSVEFPDSGFSCFLLKYIKNFSPVFVKKIWVVGNYAPYEYMKCSAGRRNIRTWYIRIPCAITCVACPRVRDCFTKNMKKIERVDIFEGSEIR